MIEHKVVDLRATGVMPGAVAEEMAQVLNECASEGWALQMIQPVIYNSATTGYFLLVFQREVPDSAG